MSARDPLRELIAQLEREIRMMALVAGQSSDEALDPLISAADAQFAGYCGKWADDLAAALRA